MKIFFIFTLTFPIMLYSYINNGWNLIGVKTSSTLDDIVKNNIFIKEALYYKNGEWLKKANIDSSDGIWIYAEKSFNNLKNNEIKKETKDYISLKKGWNLKSIPMNESLSPYIINKNIYTYTNKKWMSFNKNNKSITRLHSDVGYWINSKEDVNISLKDIKLVKADFNNNDELEKYIENVIIENRQFKYDYEYSMLTTVDSNTYKVTPESNTDSIEATSTNLQEEDVDEIDVIKHNNKDIFFLQNGYLFLTSFDDIILNKKAEKKIIRIDDNELQSYGLYLYKDKLIVFSRKNDYPTIEPYSMYMVPSISQVYINIYNISSGNFSKIKQFEIDGDIFTSRISDDKLYIINSFYPNYKVNYKNLNNDCNVVTFREPPCNIIEYNYDDYEIISKSLLPKIKDGTSEHNIVNYNNFYINPIKTNNLNILSVFSIDLQTNNFKSSSSIDGNINSFYASSDYAYFISSNNHYRSFYDYEMGSKIFAFSLKDEISFDGESNIKGRVNNQFSLSEFNGFLRIVTTQGHSWRDDTNNTLFIVKENKVISSIENMGKKGESVKAVRFFGDKAFVVTFKQTDPLYVLDLSDPYKPTQLSELEIPGFSTYFHYIDENHLLSIGKDADEEGRINGLQLQLFNISDLSKPYLQSKIKLGDKNADSAALYESKAFVYSNSTKLLSIDYSDYNNKQRFRGFKIFKIEDDIKHIKDIEKDKNSLYYYNNYSSIIFTINNKTYMGYIDNGYIKTVEIGK